jgi:hypothetical protein
MHVRGEAAVVFFCIHFSSDIEQSTCMVDMAMT